jgi:dTDP-4-amino-4,6-dideoxygalactose transaminase
MNSQELETVISVKMLDLGAQYESLRGLIEPEIRRVVESQQFILGAEVESFEKKVSEWLGSPFAIGCASGSDALLLALMSRNLEPGDEVITSPYTFFATVGAIARLGLKPVFCDIDPVSFNMDTSLLESLVTHRTRVILPVHLFGQCVEMQPVLGVASRHNLGVIEDTAQAIGATWQGKKAGTLGDTGCFSFFPSKNLGCFGDGGLLTCHDEDQGRKLRLLRHHGQTGQYHHDYLGINSRLDALQAAVLRIKLPLLEGWCRARSENAARYHRMFDEAGILALSPDQLDPAEVFPPLTTGENHVFHQYVIRVHPDRRDGLLACLREKQIGCNVYYGIPLHLQPCFQYLGIREGMMPASEQASREALALPIFPELNESQQHYVVDTIKTCLISQN